MSKNNLLKLALEVLKKLPAGAIYSNTKKPPEGATEYTTEGGAKYWVPKKTNKKLKINQNKIQAKKDKNNYSWGYYRNSSIYS